MTPLVVTAAIAVPGFACLCWIAFLVFADRHLRRGESAASIADIAKGFWRWFRWKP